MVKVNQSGSMGLMFPFVLTVLLLIGAVAFGVWAWQGRQDYKNNVDAKIAASKKETIAAEDKVQQAKYEEQLKLPFKTYAGPDAFGSIKLQFPRTWSAYVDESGQGGAAISGYFYPGVVPSVTAKSSSFALRLQVLNQNYSDVMRSYSGFVSSKKGTVTAYSLPNLPKNVGSRLDGQVQQDKQGSMVVIPLRDKTLEVWTESNQFLPDFNNYILKYLTFSP